MGLNNIKAKFQYILNIRGVETDVLAQAPINWLNTTITYKRNSVYNGLFKALSLPLGFVSKGAYLLRKEFYKNGVLSRVKVAINELVTSTLEYANVYKGRLDFSKSTDEIGSYTVNSISDDFSVQLAANDSVSYTIPIDVDEAINLELQPLLLKENAILIPNGSIAGSGAFYETMGIIVANNQQSALNPSVQGGSPTNVTGTNFYSTGRWMFKANSNTNVLISGNIYAINPADSNNPIGNDRMFIYKVFTDTTLPIPYSIAYGTNFTYSIPMQKGEELYLLMVDQNNWAITGGQLTLSYETETQATMCKAVPAMYVYRELLRAMNTNDDSGPNQPVPCKSLLLTGDLKDLYITCSDSIRTANGSFSHAGDTLFQGTYEVISGSITYNGTVYTLGTVFSYQSTSTTFSGSGVVQKLTSFLIGNIYNPGDSLQAGGRYLVGGNTGTHITYNAIDYIPGTIFNYILGQETFTGSDDSSFVEQLTVSPQIITTFKDFFQTIYGVQGGNCAFGIDSNDGACFIENLDRVYISTIGNLNAGIVDKTVKIEPATDIMCNSILTGYRDQQYSSLNAFAEVNSNQTYTSTLLQPQKQLNLQCIYRADPVGIEEIRATQSDTAASRSDNDVYMIWINENPVSSTPFLYYKPLDMSVLMTYSGVDGSYYNWKLTPKQNLLRGGNYLNSIFYKMSGYQLKLSAAPKNTQLVTVETSGRRVAEADPVNFADLPTPLFLPFYCTFKPGLPLNAMEMINSIPYGYIKFQFYGKPYKMFAQSISVDIGHNTQQEFKGLMLPNSDLTQLIR